MKAVPRTRPLKVGIDVHNGGDGYGELIGGPYTNTMLAYIQQNGDVWAYATWWGAGERRPAAARPGPGPSGRGLPGSGGCCFTNAD